MTASLRHDADCALLCRHRMTAATLPMFTILGSPAVAQEGPSKASDLVLASATVRNPHPRQQPHTQQRGEDEEAVPDALSLEVLYTADVWAAASGGIRRGTRYLDNLDVLAQADLGALVGWQGATAFAYGLYNNGSSLNVLMGDAQVASNIETGVEAVRLYEAWIDQKIGDRASLRVGLYDLNSEFDSLEASSLFIGSAHGIGTDISQTGQNGPSIFPVTSLAVRLSVDLADRWTFRTAILDGVPGDPARTAQTAIKLSGDDGALLIGEVEHRLTDGKLVAGIWHYTAPFDRIDGGQSRANTGVYLRGETHLTHEKDDTQGLAGFFRFGIANGTINQFASFGSLGLTYTGAIPGRDKDQLGLAVAVANTSSRYRLANGATDREVAFELTYRMPVTRFLTVQPNLQYVVNPGTDPSIPNALAIGLRTEIGFQF